MSGVISAQGFRLPAGQLAGNEVLNSTFDQDNYPVWASYNGDISASNLIEDTDTFAGIASWLHYSPLFNQSPYASYIGNIFYNVNIADPFDEDDFDATGHPRFIKVYGAQDWYDNQSSGILNNNPDRGDAYTGTFTDGAFSRIISNTTVSSGIGATSTFNGEGFSTQCWCRDTEWAQIIDIPDSATTCKFGAHIRVDKNDQLKPLNFGGIYVAEDANPSTGVHTRHVNYFAIRDGNATFTLPTGTLSAFQSGYNWNGLHSQFGSSTTTVPYYTPTSCTVTQHAMLAQEDYASFEKVEYEFTLQTGTNRSLMLAIFFAENVYYIHNSVTGNTGGFDVYDPFVEFSS